jgi:hypothetical protein
VNPNRGPVWTQTRLANGKMQITFDAEFIIKEKSPGWEAWQNDPTLNPKVRQAEAGEYIAEQAASSGGAGPSITIVPTLWLGN